MSLAKVILSGTVVSDPERRFTPNQNVAVTTFNMSVQAPTRGMAGAAANEAFTVKVTCWRQLAEAVGENIRKGDEVLVEGKLMINSYTTPEGVAKKGYEIDLASIDKISGQLEPVLVAAAAGAEAGSRGGGGGYDRGNSGGSGGGYATAPANRASGQSAPQQQAAPAQGGGMFQNSGSLTEDILTEDDIPF